VQTTGTPLGKYHLEVSHKQLPNAIVLLECERRSIRKRL
jgi:hypothetical protein